MPPAASGVTDVSVVKSLSGSPCGSKPHVSERICSSFCSASTVVNVLFRAARLLPVDTANSCAIAHQRRDGDEHRDDHLDERRACLAGESSVTGFCQVRSP